jgi:adenylate kinase
LSKVIYLTGAPASGKSSTTRLLAAARPDLLVWEYGARLTAHVQQKAAAVVSQDELRQKSATVVTAEDVREVDRSLLDFVSAHRSTRDIIIDSHPVTKEAFGFRITPFSLEQVTRLAPDEVWVLHADAEITIQRIEDDPAGRPTITVEEATLHSTLQASVAATYGVALGRPVYIFDTAMDRADLIQRLLRRLG